MPSGEISLEPSEHAVPGESRNLTSLAVFRNGDPIILRDSEPESDNIDPYHQSMHDLVLDADFNNQNIQDKIEAALQVLTFREQHVLVQFWWPHEFGKHQVLTTIDQPFGVGVLDAGLSSYRRDSEGRSFVVDKDHEEEDCSPAARVFRRGLPEWTPDVTNYMPKHFPQLECAISCNLHGYLALPVFDLNTPLCVGVLELLTSSKYTSFAYEVQQIHKALETVDLSTPQAFGCPTSNVPNERRQKDFQQICGILKMVCDIHSLPLAQTWAVSEHSSFVSHEKVIRKSCSSFDTRCVGKVCMSRAALPFHVQDQRMWPFLKACRERHLDSSHSFVGKALLSHGSCFCGDVTKLGEEEYPLVHHARMNSLTSCFAIFLHSVEANDDYVLELFLPPYIKEGIQLQNLVQTLKQNVEIASGFQLGDSSRIQVVEPPTVASKSVGIDLHTIQIASITTTNNNQILMGTADPESIRVYRDKEQNWTGDHFTLHDSRVVGPSKNNKVISCLNVIPQMNNNVTDAEEKHNRVKQGRKPKMDSLTMEEVEKHVGKTLDEASKSLNVSRSTLKRFCREHDISRWPLPKHNGDDPAVSKSTVKPNYTNIPDIKKVIVKVTYGVDMIKFEFPTSSGLLELEKEVAGRIDLNGRRLRLKYRDEVNDLILLACDDDLRVLLRFTTMHSTIKLIAEGR